MKKIILVVSLILVGVFFSSEVEAKTKKYSVGVREIQLDNGIWVIVWYPGKRVAGQVPYTYHGRSRRTRTYLDIQPEMAGAPYPLIIRLHGLGMGAIDAVTWSFNMAQNGYVVVSFDSRDAAVCKMDGSSELDWVKAGVAFLKYRDDFEKAVPAVFADSMSYLDNPRFRTQEVSAVLDGVLAHPFFQELIDPDKIGAAGHSFGGAAALALGHLQELNCTDPSSYSPQVCNALSTSGMTNDFLPSQCCRPAYQGKVIIFGDDRIGAIFSYGPGAFLYWPLEVDVPVFLMSGDRFEVAQANMEKPFEAFPNVYWLVIKNTDHMTWSDWIYNNIPGSPLVLKGYIGYYLKALLTQEYSLAFFEQELNENSEKMEGLKQRNCRWVDFKYKP